MAFHHLNKQIDFNQIYSERYVLRNQPNFVILNFLQ